MVIERVIIDMRFLLILLIFPTLVYSEKINLSCKIEETKKSCLSYNCEDQRDAGSADLEIYTNRNGEIDVLGINFRYKMVDWFITNVPVEKNHVLLNFRNNEKAWLINEKYTVGNDDVETKIEIDRFTGKLYLNRKMIFDGKGTYIEGNYMGDCVKDNDDKQKF